MWPIIVIAGAAALLFSRDTPTPSELSHVPALLPPPAPDQDPSFLAKARELQDLFSDSLFFNRSRSTLLFRDEARFNVYADRLKRLKQQAMASPASVAVYDRPELRRYFAMNSGISPYLSGSLLGYLSGATGLEQTLYFRGLTLGLTEYFPSAFVDGENRSRVPDWFSLNQDLLRVADPGLLAQQMSRVAGEFLHHFSPPTDLEFAGYCRNLGREQLFDLYANLRYRRSLSPELAEATRGLEWQRDPETVGSWMRFLSLLLSSRGVAPQELYLEELRRAIPTASQRNIEAMSRLLSSTDSWDPFDDAAILADPLPTFRAIISEGLSPIRSDLQRRLHGMATELLQGVAPSQREEVLQIAQSETRDSLARMPHRRWTLGEFETVMRLEGEAGMRPSELPREFREIASAVRIDLGNEEVNLMKFIEENAEWINFSVRDTGILGTTSAFSDTIHCFLVEKSLLAEDVIATLGHEAYHNYFSRRILPDQPSLWNGNLLQERNAFLFQSRIFYQWAILTTQRFSSGSEKPRDLLEIFSPLINLIESRLRVACSNRGLGFSEDDFELHHERVSNPESVPREYPNNDRMENFLKEKGFQGIKDFLQNGNLSLIGLGEFQGLFHLLNRIIDSSHEGLPQRTSL